MTSATTSTTELVVLMSQDRQPVGELPKAFVHHADTPLHLAFSAYLVDESGRLLMTRRALTKVTWPGVWTNSCCGHPGPDESMQDAIARRVDSELGLQIEGIRCALPDFAYRARDASGIWENEICPVFFATVHPSAQIRPNRGEVMEWSWTEWSDVVAATAAAPFAFSPWAVDQIGQLAKLPDQSALFHREPEATST
ncbi:isopentenyl-diphosphate delta-isomerase [Nakamurella sp. UYEF19]|uniref:isopentenyl-diphosphate Delta-isomerase n=1 Tax=Nakamurella sp. UYEF19 TaxID=1756392 RepID=UPI003399A5AA